MVQGAFGPCKIGPSRAPGGQGMRRKVLVHKIKITYLMVLDNFAFMKKMGYPSRVKRAKRVSRSEKVEILLMVQGVFGLAKSAL